MIMAALAGGGVCSKSSDARDRMLCSYGTKQLVELLANDAEARQLLGVHDVSTRFKGDAAAWAITALGFFVNSSGQLQRDAQLDRLSHSRIEYCVIQRSHL